MTKSGKCTYLSSRAKRHADKLAAMTARKPRFRPWQVGAVARTVHGLVALISAVGLGTSLWLGWTTDTQLPDGVGYQGGFDAGWEHLLNQPAYFTVLSALLVFLTSALLALKPQRTSLVFHALRLAGIICVIITGVVFNLLLRGEETLTGVSLINDTLLHQVLPVLAPVVWLLWGPRGAIRGATVLVSAVVPLVWLAVTLMRGPILDWYPYDFLDVPGRGMGHAAAYVGVIFAGYFVLAALCWGIDRLFSPKRS